ncbi:MAG TPA: lytic transglycosylase domain-containing protein, partial [Pyrinomonadaceae bacterium]|nr:lytic transglycosylase domain-containing protein [Pyrinomonadaceae bacterium]
LVFDHIARRFPKAVLLLGFVMFGFVAVASAQTPQAAVSTQAAVPAQSSAATPSSADPKAALKSNLTELSTLYENEVQRLEKQQQQSQQLYNDGIISRVEFERGQKALEEARAKVESVAKEIAVANQPVPLVIAGAESTMMGSSSSLAWSTGNSKVDGLIKLYGGQYGVDPYLIYCLMSQESSFISGAVSPKGAQGLMQLMPDTAARYGVTNPYDVAQNIKGGTRYLKDLLTMFNGRVDLALAGYNAGEGAVMKYGNTIPPYDETRSYVKLILKRYTRKPAS